MQPFVQHTGLTALLDVANVDTDQIIPKQFLREVKREGFGVNLFYDWRYLSDGSDNPEFSLNLPRYQDASVLVSRENFGCGSSREHAPWALQQYGFRAIIAPSFADIFYNNCLNNGLLVIPLPAEQVDSLFEQIEAQPGAELHIDLEARTVTAPQGQIYPFELDGFYQQRLLKGLDTIGWSEQFDADISAYEQRLEVNSSWL